MKAYKIYDGTGVDLLHLFGNLALVKLRMGKAFWGRKDGAPYLLVQLPDDTLAQLGFDQEVDRSLKLAEDYDPATLGAQYVLIEDPRTGDLIHAHLFVQGSGIDWNVATYDPQTDAIFYQQGEREGSPGRAVVSFIESQMQLFDFPLG